MLIKPDWKQKAYLKTTGAQKKQKSFKTSLISYLNDAKAVGSVIHILY